MDIGVKSSTILGGTAAQENSFRCYSSSRCDGLVLQMVINVYTIAHNALSTVDWRLTFSSAQAENRTMLVY